MKHPYRKSALLMALIAAVSLGISSFTYRPLKTDDTVTVTAAFYPMYTAALQIVGDADGVTVQCLTAPTSGCLHDYQLSPSEMLTLTNTDILLLNGAGAESFLTAALSSLTHLVCIDSSVGIDLKHAESDGHHHDHHHEGETLNSHLWTSPSLYAQQIKTLRDGLCNADPARATIYTENANAYLQKINALIQRANAVSLTDTAILFHDSAVYFADSCHLTVGAVLPAETESGLSAAQLTEAASAITNKRALFICDDQYPVHTDLLSPYAASFSVLSLDTAVTPKSGVADAERWLQAMNHNLTQLEVLTQ